MDALQPSLEFKLWDKTAPTVHRTLLLVSHMEAVGKCCQDNPAGYGQCITTVTNSSDTLTVRVTYAGVEKCHYEQEIKAQAVFVHIKTVALQLHTVSQHFIVCAPTPHQVDRRLKGGGRAELVGM